MAEQESKQEKSPLGLIIGAFLAVFLLVNVSMYMVLNLVRTRYVIPYYRLQLTLDSLRNDTLAQRQPDSLETVMANLARDFLDARYAGDSLRREMGMRTQELDRLQNEVADYRSRELELSDQQLQRLSKIFARMKPQNAAPIMQKMDDKSIIEILMKIQDRQAAKIMARMPAERAARITRTIRQEALKRARSAGGKGSTS
jgi:flagellar motility protein MotE (MotC chaperone)